MMDITNKAVKISRAICSIEESLANGDLLAREADELRIELEELDEWNDLLNAYFTARSNGEKLQAERDALAAQVGDAFGDGYYEGFIAGGKAQQEYDLNLSCADGLVRFGGYALEASEDAECNKKEKSDRKHRLAAHDAEVAKKAVQSALRMYGSTDLNNKEIIALSENYAASLRK